MNNKIKVAIYYSGRVQHENYEKNKEQILKYNEKYDVVHFCSLNERGNSEEFIDIFRNDFGIKDDQYYIENTILPVYIQKLNISVDGNLANMYSMFYHNYKCIELIKAYEDKHKIKFDVIVKFRADIKSNYFLDLESPLLENTVYIPNKFDWGGINDQVGYGNRESMIKYSECFLKFVDVGYIVKRFHPETILKGYLNYIKMNIKRITYEYHLNKH